ncbi:MauE/DoxX family redox-associated membrane protein [Smaragdicoccus niigatensis]|uniref:MauE/DoxX family redox-associated membrane protein n=1 Tax=Smaragdicoccus niigatensis TaxID=359359 RepID=UPI00035E9D39|nr:MauE/DoxX family redox-associated membrane protein [Smaragdicoccus niigatensis]
MRSWISLVARLGLAAVWLISGWIKASDPLQTVVAVRAYRLLPESLIYPVANALPLLELLLGFFLLIGFAVRQTAIASAVLLAVLMGVISASWARGLSIDCGCFGGGGVADVDGWTYVRELSRDLAFSVLAAWLCVWPKSRWALGSGSRVSLAA